MLQKIISFLIPAIVLVIIPGIISDEITCPNVTTFECADKAYYIDATFECDGFKNCADGSDEICEDCIAKLGGGLCCDAGKYIPPYWDGDGYLHCEDKTDETTCGSECLCPDGKDCLHKDSICDRYCDCDDESDEIGCPCDGGDLFLCDNGVCLKKEWMCTPFYGCSDNSDLDYCNSTVRRDVEGVLAPHKKPILRSRPILPESSLKKRAKSQIRRK